jgi:hypothetical protein
MTLARQIEAPAPSEAEIVTHYKRVARKSAKAPKVKGTSPKVKAPKAKKAQSIVA